MLSKNEIKAWSYVIAAGIIISIIITILGYPFLKSLRAVFGLIYVLFMPGFIVVRCFFWEKEHDWIEKAALSMGLSVALVILSVMFSNMIFKIPITPLWNFLVILSVMIITVLIKKYQKEINNLAQKLVFWKNVKT